MNNKRAVNRFNFSFITVNDDKEMSNGMRNTLKTPLNAQEINFVKSQIRQIQADENVFVFKITSGNSRPLVTADESVKRYYKLSFSV